MKNAFICALVAVVGIGAFAADYKPVAENTPVTIKAVTGGSTTLTVAESGQIVYCTGTNTVTLPAAAAGLQYTFVRGTATAANDIIVTAGSGDTIDGGGAAGSITNDVDAVGHAITVTAMDGTVWVTSSSSTDW
jgi:hypothetical protein